MSHAVTRPTATLKMPEKSFLPQHSEVQETSHVSNANDDFSSARVMQQKSDYSRGSATFGAGHLQPEFGKQTFTICRR
jgi:hypothetical protein